MFSSACTSNYTTQDRQNGVELDIVILIGKDNPGSSDQAEGFERLKATCSNLGLKYAFLGNGKRDVNLDDIKKLPRAKNFALWAHGSATSDGHMISLADNRISYTIDIIKDIQNKTHCKHIILCSCYSGKVIEEIKLNHENQLEPDTCLVAFSSPDDFSFIQDAKIILKDYIDEIKNFYNRGSISILNFIHEQIKKIPETMVLSYQLENEMISQTLSRDNRKIYIQSVKYCEYQQKLFFEFLDKLKIKTKNEVTIQEINKIKNKRLSISSKEIEEFIYKSFKNHLFHEDIEVMDMLLKNIKFDEVRLLEYLIESVNLFEKPDQLMRLILENMIINSGKDINEFMITNRALMRKAFLNSDKKTIKVLLESGVNIFLQDDEKHTPLGYIKHRFPQENSFFVEDIIKSNQIANFIRANIKGKQFKMLVQDKNYLGECHNIISAHDYFSKICKQERDIDFFTGKSFFPKNVVVYMAYLDLIELVKTINPNLILMNAMEKDNKNIAKQLLELDIFISFPKAIKNGDMNIFTAYIYNDINIVNQIFEKQAPIIIAIKSGHLDIVKKLLELDMKGVSVEIKHELIEQAVKSGHLAIFNELIERGFKIQNLDELQKLFLLSVQFGHIDIARKLMEMGADIHLENEKKQIPLHIAAANGRSDLIEAFWENWKKDINLKTVNGNNALHLLSQTKCSFKLIKKLLDNHVDFELNNYGYNPFHYAVKAKSILLVNKFLGINPDLINIPDKDGNSPLKIAIQDGCVYIIKYFLTINIDYIKDNPFSSAKLNQFKFDNLSLKKINFSSSSLIGTTFSNTNLSGAIYTDADLTAADFSNAIELNVYELFKAKSIRNATFDISFLTELAENKDTLDELKGKLFKDYTTYIESTDSITDILDQLEKIIDDRYHPLKVRKSGVSYFGNTATYTDVIDFGRNKLTKLLSKSLENKLDDVLLRRLVRIADEDVYSFESKTRSYTSSLVSFFVETNVSTSTPSEQLLSAIKMNVKPVIRF